MHPAAIAAMAWSDALVYLIMPAVGVGLIAVFVVSFFRPFGAKLDGAKQLIKGFGMDIQVSARTLLMLGGLALLFTGVFLQLEQKQVDGLNGKISDLTARLAIAQDEVQKAGRQAIRGSLVLPQGVSAGTLDLRDLECRYLLVAKPDQWLEAPLTQGYSGNSMRVMLTDIGRDDVIQQIVVRKRATSEVLGVSENFYPLQPVIRLEKPEAGQP